MKTKNRTLLAALAPSALGLGLSAAVWKLVPDPMPIHWDAHGVANGFAPKTVGLLMLPIMGLATSGIMGWAMSKASDNRAVVDGSVAGVGGFLLGIHALAITAALTPGFQLSMTPFMVLMGALFAGLGLAMPHLKQNKWAGVRTPWTLGDERNWALTHRFAGWSMGIGGAVAIVAALVLSPPAMFWVAIAAILVGAFLPMGYSYLLHWAKSR